jgi:hypothetical protein
MSFSLPLKLQLAPSGWRCLHRRPLVMMGSSGNLVICYILQAAWESGQRRMLLFSCVGIDSA